MLAMIKLDDMTVHNVDPFASKEYKDAKKKNKEVKLPRYLLELEDEVRLEKELKHKEEEDRSKRLDNAMEEDDDGRNHEVDGETAAKQMKHNFARKMDLAKKKLEEETGISADSYRLDEEPDVAAKVGWREHHWQQQTEKAGGSRVTIS